MSTSKSSTKTYKVGTAVSWPWGGHTAHGVIAEVFTDSVTRTIKGTSVTRNATPSNPAYMVEQEKGTRALKSHSELTAS